MIAAVSFSASIALADDSVGVSITEGTADSGGGSTVTIEVVHNESTTGRVGATDAPSRAGSKSTCTFGGAEIDCTSTAGVWSQAKQCFVAKVTPQPDADSPSWNGRTDGAIYQCTPPGATFSAGLGSGYWFWAPDGGDDGAPDLVDPVTLAERAIDRMNLLAPRVGMTPLDSGAPVLVGMDVWLWVDGDGERMFGPITRSVSAGPTTVEATARVTRAVWEMGDGRTVTCHSAGTQWSPVKGTGPSPTCGHRYHAPSTGQPGDTYEVGVTTHWRVEWTGGGQSGRITFTMTGARDIEVTELQVLETT